jgi:hypothetical protein
MYNVIPRPAGIPKNKPNDLMSLSSHEPQSLGGPHAPQGHSKDGTIALRASRLCVPGIILFYYYILQHHNRNELRVK